MNTIDPDQVNPSAAEPPTQNVRCCPVCGTPNELEPLSKREYRCSQCNLELAHLDVTANGVIRGIFGWLRTSGDIIAERYRIKSVLGKGGFGATYLVEDLKLNGKRRALKEVPELMFDEYETTLLSRLNHPSIPDIIDRNVADGMVYLVLEFGGSQTLGGERKQCQGRIPQAKLLPWMRQLCEVLIYLHAQQPPIIHRDLKPDNILLDENERIMLIDFGLAKESTPATMTRTLGRAATHGFSPPEQVMGTGTDERSDIYALGATFYALLTGQNPPAAHERVAGKELQPPSQIVPEISPQLDDVIVRALNLNVNHRQHSVREFSDALDAIQSEHPPRSTVGIESTERTVLVGQATAATIGKQPSIKLPSGRITAPEQAAAIGKTAYTPKRNVILPLAILAVVLAGALTAAYLFFSRSESDKTISSSPPQPPIALSPVPEPNPLPDQPPVPASTPAIEAKRASPPGSQPEPVVIPATPSTGTATSGAVSTGEPPPNKGESALDAFEKRINQPPKVVTPEEVTTTAPSGEAHPPKIVPKVVTTTPARRDTRGSGSTSVPRSSTHTTLNPTPPDTPQKSKGFEFKGGQTTKTD